MVYSGCTIFIFECKRVKQDIQDVDIDDIMQRFQKVEILSYRYTEEWRKVRGLENDVSVRGVVAQQLKEVFPEYVKVIDRLDLPDKNFTMDGMHQVDKQALVLDLIAAFKAHHQRLRVDGNTGESSGSIRISSPVDEMASASDSGSLFVKSGETQNAIQSLSKYSFLTKKQ